MKISLEFDLPKESEEAAAAQAGTLFKKAAGDYLSWLNLQLGSKQTDDLVRAKKQFKEIFSGLV